MSLKGIYIPLQSLPPEERAEALRLALKVNEEHRRFARRGLAVGIILQVGAVLGFLCYVYGF